ncbi:putative transposase-like protein [Trichonephila clavipes]|nr:putative transposase-like protein [Trichonephila clavipes]
MDPYICVKNFILACLHPPRSPTREAVCRSSGKNQAQRLPGVHPEYNATASGRGSNRYWFGKSMNAFVVNDLKVNKNTVVNWYMFCREVCMIACVKESAKLGGVGEIDESLFGKMKYGKGRKVNGKWVFGGVQRESKKCFFHVVESRTKEELHKDEGYVHLRVNHSLTFVDPETGAHSNSIEGT